MNTRHPADMAEDDFTAHSMEVMENEGGVGHHNVPNTDWEQQDQFTTAEFYQQVGQRRKEKHSKPFFVR